LPAFAIRVLSMAMVDIEDTGVFSQLVSYLTVITIADKWMHGPVVCAAGV
jgi:hypothetical protein